MAKSTRERFFEKLGIRLEPQDPVSLDENYFLVLGLEETLSPQETVAKIPTAVLSRQRQIKNYGHIDTTVSGEFGHLLSKAAAALGDPSQVQQHRDQLQQRRLSAFVEKEAQLLRESGVERSPAETLLKKKAPAFGFPKNQLPGAVSEAIGRLWGRDEPLKPPDEPTVPGKLWGAYAALVGLAFLGISGLAVLLAVVGAALTAFLAYREQNRRYAIWAGGFATCLGLAMLPVAFTGQRSNRNNGTNKQSPGSDEGAPLDLAGRWASKYHEYIEFSVQGQRITSGVIQSRGVAGKGQILEGSIEGPNRATYRWKYDCLKTAGTAVIERQNGAFEHIATWQDARGHTTTDRYPIWKVQSEAFAQYVDRSTFENEYISIFEMDIQGTRVVGGRSVARNDPDPDNWGRVVDGHVHGDKIDFRWTWKGQTGTGVIERLPDGGIRGTNPASGETHVHKRSGDKLPKGKGDN